MYCVMAIFKSSVVWGLWEETESGAQRLWTSCIKMFQVTLIQHKFIRSKWYTLNQWQWPWHYKIFDFIYKPAVCASISAAGGPL